MTTGYEMQCAHLDSANYKACPGWQKRAVAAKRLNAQTRAMSTKRPVHSRTAIPTTSTHPLVPVCEVERSIHDYLLTRYGPVLDNKAIVEVLRFPTVTALERSFQRGNLTLQFMPLVHRRGMFVLAHEMARYLAGQVNSEDSQQQQKLGKERRIRQSAA